MSFHLGEHNQACDNCGRKFLRGTLARRRWYEADLYLCKECLESRGESVDPINYNHSNEDTADLIAQFIEAQAQITQHIEDAEKLVAQIEHLTTTRESGFTEYTDLLDRLNKTSDLLRRIRDEVMQYPMNQPAEKLVNTLYELMC